MRCEVLETPEAIGDAVARDIASRMAAAPGDRPFLIGCPSGRSPRPVYAALARQRLPLSRLVVVMMDEYVRTAGEGFACVPADAHNSCSRFAQQEIAGVLNAGRAAGDVLLSDHIWMPDPADPLAYDARIEAQGGIDLFLLACGAGDGHVAFNPPGSARDSRTRIVRLAEQTRRDNMATFPAFRALEEVPCHGITVGIGTIADLSRAATMIVWGADKRRAWVQLGRAGGYDPQWPASIISECREAVLYGDRAAAGI